MLTGMRATVRRDEVGDWRLEAGTSKIEGQSSKVEGREKESGNVEAK